MKTLKFALVFVALLCFGTFAMAQDYSGYLESAKRLLKEGDCDKAKSNYDVYVKLTGQAVSWLDSDIKDCIAKKTKPKTYNIGDSYSDITGYSTDRDYKIAYIDGSGKHGYAIKFDEWSNICMSPEYGPSLSELKDMYRHRYSLGVTGEYWSTTEVPGTGKGWSQPKYYTFDFSTGRTNERRNVGNEVFQNMWVERF